MSTTAETICGWQSHAPTRAQVAIGCCGQSGAAQIARGVNRKTYSYFCAAAVVLKNPKFSLQDPGLKEASFPTLSISHPRPYSVSRIRKTFIGCLLFPEEV